MATTAAPVSSSQPVAAIAIDDDDASAVLNSTSAALSPPPVGGRAVTISFGGGISGTKGLSAPLNVVDETTVGEVLERFAALHAAAQGPADKRLELGRLAMLDPVDGIPIGLAERLPVLDTLGVIEKNAADSDDEESISSAAIEAESDSDRLRRTAAAAFKEHQYKRARDACARIVELGGAGALASDHVQLGRALAKVGDHEAAVAALELGLEGMEEEAEAGGGKSPAGKSPAAAAKSPANKSPASGKPPASPMRPRPGAPGADPALGLEAADVRTMIAASSIVLRRRAQAELSDGNAIEDATALLNDQLTSSMGATVAAFGDTTKTLRCAGAGLSSLHGRALGVVLRHQGLGAGLRAEPAALHTLNLRCNMLRAEGAEQLALALGSSFMNRSLTWLDCSENAIGEAGAVHLAKMLADNASLKVLKLNMNKIGCSGGAALAEGCAKNEALAELGLAANALYTEGAEAFGAVGYGRLEHLDLRDNFIQDRAERGLGLGFKHARTLRCLDLRGNLLGQDALYALGEHLRKRRRAHAKAERKRYLNERDDAKDARKLSAFRFVPRRYAFAVDFCGLPVRPRPFASKYLGCTERPGPRLMDSLQGPFYVGRAARDELAGERAARELADVANDPAARRRRVEAAAAVYGAPRDDEEGGVPDEERS